MENSSEHSYVMNTNSFRETCGIVVDDLSNILFKLCNFERCKTEIFLKISSYLHSDNQVSKTSGTLLVSTVENGGTNAFQSEKRQHIHHRNDWYYERGALENYSGYQWQGFELESVRFIVRALLENLLLRTKMPLLSCSSDPCKG